MINLHLHANRVVTNNITKRTHTINLSKSAQASLPRGIQNWNPLEREVGYTIINMVDSEQKYRKIHYVYI